MPVRALTPMMVGRAGLGGVGHRSNSGRRDRRLLEAYPLPCTAPSSASPKFEATAVERERVSGISPCRGWDRAGRPDWPRRQSRATACATCCVPCHRRTPFLIERRRQPDAAEEDVADAAVAVALPAAGRNVRRVHTRALQLCLRFAGMRLAWPCCAAGASCPTLSASATRTRGRNGRVRRKQRRKQVAQDYRRSASIRIRSTSSIPSRHRLIRDNAWKICGRTNRVT